MKTLEEIVREVPGAYRFGTETAVRDVTLDSRQVQPGALFVAVPGERFDGHDFIAAAVSAGACALVVQADRAASILPTLALPGIVVPDSRRALGPIACALFGHPSRRLFLAGITGTNGKTTTTRMIDSIARAAGETTGVLGTLGATLAGKDLPGERTTPEAPDLQRLLAQMVDAGAVSAAMEVASHALVLGRVEGTLFDIGVFTNLTQDHLDFHGTMEAYRDAKGRLFTEMARQSQAAGKRFAAVLNADDPAGRHFGALTPADCVLTYSPAGGSADIVPEDVELGIDRIVFTARTPAGAIPVRLGFGGTFQVANALAAVGYGVARALPNETIAAGLAQCLPVPGRFQPVRAGQPFAVLVDYAHTPDGIENALRAARPLTAGRLILVFGCGGNRDRTKRPKMGCLAKELADIAIVTSDNPRREDPEAILDEILAGMQGDGALIRRETDRRRAIAAAVDTARPGDTVLIAGKGHEEYQILGETTVRFSDVEVAEEELRRCAAR